MTVGIGKRLGELVWFKGLGELIGFGYRPWNPLFLSIGVIGINAAIFEIGLRTQAITPTFDCARRRGWMEASIGVIPKVQFLDLLAGNIRASCKVWSRTVSDS
jgi:hypothetical protein